MWRNRLSSLRSLRAEVLPLHALNMAAFNAQGPLDEPVHHTDYGPNHLSIAHTDRIIELGAKPSTGPSVTRMTMPSPRR